MFFPPRGEQNKQTESNTKTKVKAAITTTVTKAEDRLFLQRSRDQRFINTSATHFREIIL